MAPLRQAILDVFFAYLAALRAQGVDMDLYKSLQAPPPETLNPKP